MIRNLFFALTLLFSATASAQPWQSGQTNGLSTVTPQGVTVGSFDLPSGWASEGATFEWSYHFLVISNPDQHDLTVSVFLTDISGNTVWEVFSSGSVPKTTQADALIARGEIQVVFPDNGFGEGAYFRTGQLFFGQRSRVAGFYTEGPKLSDATRLVVVAYSKQMKATLFFLRGRFL